MRSVILMGCLGMITLSAGAQNSGRAKQSSLPLGIANKTAVSYNSNVGSLNRVDTFSYSSNQRPNNTAADRIAGSPTALRFSDVQAQCYDESMVLTWQAIQQFNADRYEIEQSDDQRHWKVVGVVPANRTEFGRADYQFTYNKNTGTSLFRITGYTTGQEKIFSAAMESPCSARSYLAVTPNPVYSTATVRIGSPAAARVKLILLNAFGAALQQREASLQSGTNHVPLNMSSLPPGSYTLMIIWSNGKEESLQVTKH